MHAQTPGRKPNGRLKIKVEQATCDQCRSNGVLCLAPDSVDERCGQCEDQGVTCTWKIGPRPMGRSPPSPSYISYLESQVGKVERKLREILPGVNLNRELETLAQVSSSPPPQKPTFTHLSDTNPSTSSQSSSGGATPFQHASSPEPPVLYSAPQLLKQVRLASEVEVETSSPYAKQKQDPRGLRADTYWSATASTKPEEPRFHGQSSGEILLRDAKEIKQEFVELSLGTSGQVSAGNNPNQSTQGQGIPPTTSTASQHRVRIRRRRSQFWKPTRPEQRSMVTELWSCDENSASGFSEVRLPPPDLVHSLVDLFFEYINPFFPILHQGTFELELARGTHLLQVLQRRAQDEKNGVKPDTSKNSFNYYRFGRGGPEGYPSFGPLVAGGPIHGVDYTRGAGTFARVLLLVCACASRWSDDPRVLSTSTTGGSSNASEEYGAPSSLSAGYDFFREIGPLRWTMCAQPSLWDVQIFILAALFLHGSSAHYGAWTVLGIGIRLAQDIGAHRKKDGLSIENELYKRTFWALLLLDRLMCGTFGRPSAMQDLDSDLDNVIEVDDEYWPVGGQPAQLPGKPSRLAFFNGMIGLSRVQGRALQTVFAIDRTKKQMGLVGHEKEQELLADLRRHLERWKRTVPPHLQLQHPDHFEPSVFLDQIVSLWATYYNINILIHRPFITIKTSPLTTECLNICRTSARAFAKIMEGHMRLSTSKVLPSTIQAAFSSAMVLLVDILATKKEQRQKSRADVGESGAHAWPVSEDWYPTSEKEMDVERCRRVLARAEKNWHVAGQLHDTLREFQRSGTLLTGSSPSTNTSTSARIHTVKPVSAPQGTTGTFNPSYRPSGLPSASNVEFRQDVRTTSVPNPSVPYETNPVSSVYASYGATQQYGSTGYDNTGYDNPQSTTGYSYTPSSNTYYPEQSYIPAQPDSTTSQYNSAEGYPTDSGAYLPEAYYGDNMNIPFPGLVPQFNFAPNQGREDVTTAEYQESLGGVQNPGWPSAAQRSTSLSHWEQLLRNATWDSADGSQPQP